MANGPSLNGLRSSANGSAGGPWQERSDRFGTGLDARSLQVRQATLHDRPEVWDLTESADSASVFATPKAELHHCMAGNLDGVYVAVGPDGRLVGAAYTQRINSHEALLTRPTSVLAMHTPSAPMLHLIGIVQQREARVRMAQRLSSCSLAPPPSPWRSALLQCVFTFTLGRLHGRCATTSSMRHGATRHWHAFVPLQSVPPTSLMPASAATSAGWTWALTRRCSSIPALELRYGR